MKIRSLLLNIFVLTTVSAFSQVGAAQDTGIQFKRNVATVLFSSLGGAILGLSTLSFYPNAQDHVGNVSTGAALGFVGGLGYVLYTGTSMDQYGNQYSAFDLNKKPVFVSPPALVSFNFEF